MHEALGWVRDSAIPITTVEAGNGFADLEPLRRVIGDARIVSLGEATHGTRELFQLMEPSDCAPISRLARRTEPGRLTLRRAWTE